jgi:hypothetical protein
MENKIEVIWKSIEKDGLPSKEGRYLCMIRGEKNELFLSFSTHSQEEIRHMNYCEYYLGPVIEYKPPEDPKTINFSDAIKVVLDGGKVRATNWPLTDYLMFKNKLFLTHIG